MLDRLDLQVEVPPQTTVEIESALPRESSAVVNGRILAARARQHERGTLDALLPATGVQPL